MITYLHDCTTTNKELVEEFRKHDWNKGDYTADYLNFIVNGRFLLNRPDLLYGRHYKCLVRRIHRTCWRNPTTCAIQYEVSYEDYQQLPFGECLL